jgi:hypothetical protein
MAGSRCFQFERFESSKQLKRLSIANSRSNVNVTYYNNLKISSVHVPFAEIRGSGEML